METPEIYLHFLNFIISQSSIEKKKFSFVLGPYAYVQYGEEGLVVGERDRRGQLSVKTLGIHLTTTGVYLPKTLCWNKSLQPFLNLKKSGS